MTTHESPYTKRFFSMYSQEEKEKIRGHAFYPSDHLSALLPEGVAHVYVVRSPHAGAKFTKLDTVKAVEQEGVIRVITAKDIPSNKAFGGRSKKSQLILAENEVNFVGEPVALVVAEEPEQAKEAAKLIKIDWEVVKHEPEEVVETLKFERGEEVSGNLEFTKTDFKFPSLHARYLEPECGWVELNAQGQLFFRVGSYLSESQRLWLSQVLDHPVSQIRAEESYLGGQFGGRQQRELIVFLALASVLSKRSCCLELEYENQDVGTYGYSGELEIGYDAAAGRMRQLRGKLRIDSGCYEGKASKILMRALEHVGGVYDFESIRLEGDILRTPTHPRRALKGEGLTAVTWVTEQLIDKIAKELEIDPLDFRVSHSRSESAGISKVVEELEKVERSFELISIDRNRPVWDAKRINGRGLALQVFQTSKNDEFDQVEVSIELQGSGSFQIRFSNLTLDLRMKAAVCEVAAAVLRTHPKAMTVDGKMRMEFDKARRRETYPEFYYLAQATWHAADRLRQQLVEAGRELFKTQDVELHDGAVSVKSTGRKMGYRELAFTHGVGDLKSEYILEKSDQPHSCTGGAVSRVSFDPLTGELSVDSVKVVLDAGPVISLTGLEAEAESAVAWVMAALFKSSIERDQPIPTPVDGPEEVSLFPLEYPMQSYADSPPEIFGSRGLPDVTMAVVLASMVNAIQDAKEMTLDSIPMEPSFMYPEKKQQSVPLIPFKR